MKNQSLQYRGSIASSKKNVEKDVSEDFPAKKFLGFEDRVFSHISYYFSYLWKIHKLISPNFLSYNAEIPEEFQKNEKNP